MRASAVERDLGRRGECCVRARGLPLAHDRGDGVKVLCTKRRIRSDVGGVEAVHGDDESYVEGVESGLAATDTRVERGVPGTPPVRVASGARVGRRGGVAGRASASEDANELNAGEFMVCGAGE